MLFVNRSKLAGKIAEQGMKQKDVAEELCITNTAFTLKMQSKRQFKEDELVALARLFGTEIFITD